MVSIIVPVYNVERFIDRCVESLCLQTYKKIQVILVDDGSTDFSSRKCDQWAEKDMRVQVIHQGNMGLSAARNTGLEQAEGEFLLFVDGDDYVHPDYIRLLAEKMIKCGSDIVMCNYSHVDEEGKPAVDYYYTCLENKDSMNRIEVLQCFEDQKYTHFFHVVWNKMFRRELFHEVRFPVGISLVEDVTVMPLLYYNSKKITIIGEKLYYYVHRKNSLSRGTFDKEAAYRLRKPMLENRITKYREWGIKELVLICYIHLYSLIAVNEKQSKERGMIQKKYREVYRKGRYRGQVPFTRRLKFLIAAVNMNFYHHLTEKKK